MKYKFRYWDKRYKKIKKSPNRPTLASKSLIHMLCSNMKDKTGKEIYEGDICTLKIARRESTFYDQIVERDHIGEIKFENGAFFFRLTSKAGNNSDYYLSGNAYKLTIIGNKYENAELLQEEIYNASANKTTTRKHRINYSKKSRRKQNTNKNT